MQTSAAESMRLLLPLIEKKKRGRPRKHLDIESLEPKRSRGRPRKHPVLETEASPKRGRGRPRKYPVLEKEVLPNGEIKPNFRKVDSCHLLKQMLNYFTKLLILHSKLATDAPKLGLLFERLKQLDFQMAEVCKTLLVKEFGQEGEDQEAA